MDENDAKTVPTASESMLQKSNSSELAARAKWNQKNGSHRMRSKSECNQSQLGGEAHAAIMGEVIKSKDKLYDKRPKNLKGSGKMKKNGAGGKGTWGRNGELYEEEVVDPSDPNYDPENSKNEGVIMQEILPDLTSPEFDKVVTPMLLEYYDHGIPFEVATSLCELNIMHLKHRIIYLAITLAMEQHGAQREMTSSLLSALYGEKIVHEQDFELGYQALMNALPDLELDTPDAADVLGKFMARSVADDCLQPCYIREHMEHPSEKARVALERANRLLQARHGIVRLDSIWGHGGGIRPVKLLVKEIVLMIKEYLSSNDVAEAERCIRDLDVPHFHHEIVYEAIAIALEDGTDKTINEIVKLLNHLLGDTMITENQMNAGFERVYSSMEDIILDSPHAYRYLSTIVDLSSRSGLIPLWLRQKAPSRGRKRFVSEGDFSMSSKSFATEEKAFGENGFHEEILKE